MSYDTVYQPELLLIQERDSKFNRASLCHLARQKGLRLTSKL